MDGFRAGLDLAGDTRWAYFVAPRRDEARAELARGRSSVVEVGLLDASTKGHESVNDAIVDPRGLIAVRYSYAQVAVPDNPPRAGEARIEVGWYDGLVGRTYRGTLARVPFTELPRFSPEDLGRSHCHCAIGDQGLLLHAFGSRGAWLMGRDGRVENVSWPVADPPEIAVGQRPEVMLDRARIVVVENLPTAVRVQRTEPPWKSWETLSWPWSDEPSSERRLVRGPRWAAVLDYDHWLFPFDPTSPEPPHAPVEVWPSSPTERYESCSTEGLGGVPMRVERAIQSGPRAPEIRMNHVSLATRLLALRVASDGHACLSAVLAEGNSLGVLLAPHDPERSWGVAWDGQRFTVKAHPLRCRQVAPDG